VVAQSPGLCPLENAMPTCESFQSQLLDHLYGLLDDEEGRVLREHLGACSACAGALRTVEEQRRLLALAAKTEFPEVTFRPRPDAEAVEKHRSIAFPRVRPVLPRWSRWAVAAGLVLAAGVAGTLIWSHDASLRADVLHADADKNRAARERERLERDRIARAQKDQDEIRAVQDEIDEAIKKRNTSGLQARVIMPATTQAGGRTEAEVFTENLLTTPVDADLDVVLREKKSGKVVFEKKGVRSHQGKATVVLPPLPQMPGTQYGLQVVARRDNGARVTVAADNLVAPLCLTHLCTDKPMYQPGEVVSFRSLTLQRFRLTPLPRPVYLTYRITAPGGAQVFTTSGTDQLRQANQQWAPVLGPDNKQPVRGIGTGAYQLPPNAPGGLYTLTVAVTVPDDQGKPFLVQEQNRQFLVNKYEKPRLTKELEFTRKSYGPGDEVVAACKLARVEGGKALADQEVKATVLLDGTIYDAAGKPVKGPESGIVLRTDAQGAVSVRFRLPSQIEVGDASLTVTFTDGASHETLVRPIPVVLKKLDVEFFPEGGDLVAGPSNRLYFQARTPLGKPAEMKGRIVDAAGKVVANVATLSDDKEPGANQGMGVVELADLTAGTPYELKIDSPSGIDGRFILPEVKADGVVLRIAGAAVTDTIPVSLRNGPKDRTLLVDAYCRGLLLDRKTVTLKKGETTRVDLKPNADVGGVFRVTVFERLGADDQRLLPIAERLTYRAPARKLGLQVRSDKKDYSPGEHVKLFFQAANESGQPAPAILLVAVVDNRVLTLADEKTARSMPSQFYLMTEVRNPEDLEHADFLVGDQPLARQALDLLLGTQGWRRFAEQKPIDEFKRTEKRAADQLVKVSGQERLEKAKTTQGAIEPADQFQARIVMLFSRKAELQVASQKAVQDRGQQLDSAVVFLGKADRSLRAANDKLDAYWANVRMVSLFVLGGLLAIAAIAALAIGLVRASYHRGRAELYIAAGACCLVLFVVAMVGGLSSVGPDQHGQNQMADLQGAHKDKDEKGEAVQKWEGRLEQRFGGGEGMAMPRPMAAAREAAPKKPAGFAMAPLAPEAPAAMPMVANGAKKEVEEAKQDKAAARLDRALDLRALEQAPGRGGGLAKDGAMAGLRGPIANGKRRALGAGPMAAPFVVREYAHQHRTTKGNLRTDFAETLYWHPVLVLPDGKGEAAFDLSDSVTAFQVLAYGHTLDGRLGALTSQVKSRLPFTLEPKVPIEVTASDKIVVPLSIGNATDLPRAVTIQMETKGLSQLGSAARNLNLGAEQSVRRLFQLQPSIVEGLASLTFKGQCAPFAEDRIERQIAVVPDGFPIADAHSEQLEKSDSYKITLPAAWLKGTLKVRAEVYPSTLAALQKGLESLLREPNGCFEQASTSNYPNVLVLDYLKENNSTNPEIIRRTRQLLDNGYARLTQYECDAPERKKKGYEWFGGSAPAHEALTAYGLLQFRDMARVYPVDKAMIERTRKYLLDQKDGKGGFKRNPRALDTFGAAPPHITNAYIVWALTEGGAEDDVTAELAALTEQAKTSKDPYFLALVANSLLNRSKAKEAETVLQTLVAAQKDDGHLDGTETSITRSGGKDFQLETTALTVLAWLKANHPQYAAAVRKAVTWIGQQRGAYGGFGSTQSTILVLKALIAHTRANKKTAEAGELTLKVGGKVVDRKTFAAGAQGVLTANVPDADNVLKPGANQVEVEITGKNVFPYTLSWSYRTLKPDNAARCPVQLTNRLDRAQANEADSIRLTATVENKTGQGQGMAVAIIGLPGGISLPEDMKQLKGFMHPRSKDAKAGEVSRYISFYEVRGRELILYWRDLAKDEKIEIGLDLICRVPGEYRGPASRAYLYYNAKDKFWTEPLQVQIKPKGEN
jgi:hypothetical protein